MSNSDHKIVAMTRLLHFTDMHLRQHQPGTAGDPARLSRLMPAALDRLADRIKALAPDVVVMTGDVLDVPNEVIIGRTPDDRPLQSWIDDAVDDLVLVKDWFDGTGVAYMVMPGNHDHEAAFSRVFGDTSGARDIAGIRFFCFWDALASDRQPRRSGSRCNGRTSKGSPPPLHRGNCATRRQCRARSSTFFMTRPWRSRARVSRRRRS